MRGAFYRIHGRGVKGAAHLGHDAVMEAGGREFDPRPGHYGGISFQSDQETGRVF